MTNLDALSITNLNFEDIKDSFKAFLKKQDNFTDYNLEGSNFAILFDILAYNTYYMAMYQNFISSESWLDSATLRSSLVSLSKPLGFMPRTKRCSKFVVNISIQSNVGDISSFITIPIYSRFSSGAYTFLNIEPIILKKNLEGKFENQEPIVLYEGTKIVYRFISNDRNFYKIPYEALDSTTLVVNVFNSLEHYEKVQATGDYTTAVPFFNSCTINKRNADSNIYFLQEAVTEEYEIYFGDGVIGTKIPSGLVIETTFIKPSGPVANEQRALTFDSTESGNTSIAGYSAIAITPLNNSTAFGGIEKQEQEDIRRYAPYHYEAQDRIVSLNDYNYFVTQYIGEYERISIWGGEDNNPPRYGSVFCMVKPKGQNRLSEFEKYALKNYIQNKSVVGLEFNIVDPNIVYVIPTLKIRYASAVTKNLQLFYTRVTTAIRLFAENISNSFRASDLVIHLKDNINSIRSLTIRIKLLKRMTPIESVSNYQINFDTMIMPGTITSLKNFTLDKSSDFTEVIYDNSSGLMFYDKTNNITQKTTSVQIGTVNYNKGLIELEEIRILEMRNDPIYGSDFVFSCSAVEDDFIGTHNTFPVFDFNNILIDYIPDNG